MPQILSAVAAGFLYFAIAVHCRCKSYITPVRHLQWMDARPQSGCMSASAVQGSTVGGSCPMVAALLPMLHRRLDCIESNSVGEGYARAMLRIVHFACRSGCLQGFPRWQAAILGFWSIRASQCKPRYKP